VIGSLVVGVVGFALFIHRERRVGRWYDRAGGRPPLVVGFGFLAVAGILLAFDAQTGSYPWLLPGLLAYGVGLAILLTVNDPVSIDTVPEPDHGQVSGVSATAEQGGGAIGIALLYAVFHSTYIAYLQANIAARGLPALNDDTSLQLRDALNAAEQVGLNPATFDPRVATYLDSARSASDFGYSVTFLATSLLALIGLVATAVLVRKPTDPSTAATGQTTVHNKKMNRATTLRRLYPAAPS
jgi:MFS family permease